MGLYLCIFDETGEDELGACDVGHYSDFGSFRDTIARHMRAADFPVLMTHSDCDGEWAVEQLPALVRELETIAAKFRTLPSEQFRKVVESISERIPSERESNAVVDSRARFHRLFAVRRQEHGSLNQHRPKNLHPSLVAERVPMISRATGRIPAPCPAKRRLRFGIRL